MSFQARKTRLYFSCVRKQALSSSPLSEYSKRETFKNINFLFNTCFYPVWLAYLLRGHYFVGLECYKTFTCRCCFVFYVQLPSCSTRDISNSVWRLPQSYKILLQSGRPVWSWYQATRCRRYDIHPSRTSLAFITRPSTMRPHHALHPACLSVRPSVCPVPTVNSKTKNCRTLKLREEVTRVWSNWRSNFEVKRLKIKVTVGGILKSFLAHIFVKKISLHVKLKPWWLLFRSARFVHDAATKMRTFQDNWATILEAVTQRVMNAQQRLANVRRAHPIGCQRNVQTQNSSLYYVRRR